MSGILVGSKCRASSTLYSRPTPNRLIATTNSPLTAPPRNAICRALFRLERAALAVRMFERTATYMPTKPATPEQNAPNRKDSVVVSASVTAAGRSEEHTSELQSQSNLVCRLLLEKKKAKNNRQHIL